jgi:hypothetical protein
VIIYPAINREPVVPGLSDLVYFLFIPDAMSGITAGYARKKSRGLCTKKKKGHINAMRYRI